ncbi:hypothetical protein P4631_07955 [Halalkalibacterium halodurans]|uniref:hypothetical protein n=1 Tax=Halalkalibacterium halodurans TaxID=86665 RepID=UPI002E1FA4B1|nr:hypothetical protein [Halalkalibacterium halodurans]
MKMPSRGELIQLVEKIMNAEGTVEEIDRYMNVLEKNVPDPNVSDLIFWNDEELSAGEIVVRALNYKPNLLP